MAPRVRLTTTAVAPGQAPSQWRVTWRITNDGAEPLDLEDAWIPHGRFRGEGRLPLGVHVGPGASLDLSFTVHAAEAPGTGVENAFLIIRARGRAADGVQTWRVFSRMRIVFDGAARPWPHVETVTLQPVGGSVQ